MEQVKVIEKIMISMTSRFNYVICSVEESNNVEEMTIDELQASLLVHEQRMNGNDPVGEEQALKVTFDERVGGRGRSNYRGRGRGRGRLGQNRAQMECYKCHKLGHLQYDCPTWEKRANFAELDESEELLLMSCVELKNAPIESIWFLDSGCSNHMSGNKNWFSDLDEGYRHVVKLGNNMKMPVMGRGSIKLDIDGMVQVITDVHYVPDLKNNLLSLGQLQQKGLTIVFQGEGCKVHHARRGIIMQTQMTTNRMFAVIARVVLQELDCFQAKTEDETALWHGRFGHLNYKALRTLQYKKMVNGLPRLNATTKVCKHCLIGKQHREPMPKTSKWRAAKPLQLIHADICGPINPTSNAGKRYLISFIDDYSRKMWVYFLNTKSEAFITFKQFRVLAEKEIGESICCLRTDRGGEFASIEFNQYCVDNGIKRQLTAAYTPQQNGVAERRNRTVMNMVRCLLSQKDIPKPFWPEAVRWTVHVLNRSPTSAVKDRTPEEAWCGIKPSVEYFRVFGCLAHVHIPDQTRIKLDNKSLTCVLLGVSEESKAYKLYDPVARKVIISRDVVFEEEERWKWEHGETDRVNDELTWGDAVDDEPVDTVEDNEDDGQDDEDITTRSEADINEVANDQVDTPVSSTRRIRRQPRWLDDYVSGEGLGLSSNSTNEDDDVQDVAMFISHCDPSSYEEAATSKKWRDAMDLEINAIERNHTWKLVELPPGAKTIGVKWVYKTKINASGEIDKCKARLVAKGYAQQHGIDYNEVFAPVARWDTIRMILALAAQQTWTVYQLDVKSAFLHGKLEEIVFVDQPLGYEKVGEENKVYKLEKALYGLKQAPRAWYSRIEAYFLKEGFLKCSYEHTLFTKTETGGKVLIVSLYVDDLIYTGNDANLMEEFKTSMELEFDMTNLGKMRYFLGVEVFQNSSGIHICQRKYAREVLERFGMEHSNSVRNPIVPGSRLTKEGEGAKVNETVYKQLIGSLMYLTATRPDLMYVVCLISRFMAAPTEAHMLAAKRVLRYVKGTLDYGVFYESGGKDKLIGYCDSDYAGDLDDRKSTTGFVFMLSKGAVSWCSKKQPVVTLSTTEAEFVAATACACQGVWMRRVFESLKHEQGECTTLYCDNSSTIKLSKNPVLHGRSKHIDVRYHFLRDLTKDGVIELAHCNTGDQLADLLTKPLKLEAFEKLRRLLGVQVITE